MSKATLELRNERSLRDSLDRVGLKQATGPQVVSVFAILAGALGIALVAARILPESIQSNLTSRPVLSGLIGVVGLLSIASALPLGRSLTRRLSIPYEGVGQDLGKFTFLAAELGILVLVFRLFNLETAAFYEDIAVLAFAGFLVHHFLPTAYRLPFFLALSLIGILSVVGPVNAAWIVGIGLLLVGITRLPLAFNLRVVLVLAVAAVLALFRANLVPAPFSLVVFPIVGSIFMFRLVIYMYDLKHSKSAPGLTQTLSYFFLLPNVIFPLFPPVDFTAFRRTYFDSDQYEIYQRGIRMLVRGTTYLLLYRFLYYYVVIAPSDVNNAGDLLRYLTSNYMLILRIIGDYDLIVGMLHLFGFNLGDANLLNFFATSFTDFWRRANIYWKDLMLKVVYYPSVLSASQAGSNSRPGARHRYCLYPHLVAAFVPMVLDSRRISPHASRRTVLGLFRIADGRQFIMGAALWQKTGDQGVSEELA